MLENLRQSLNLRRPRLVSDLRELGRHLERAPTMREVLDGLGLTLDDVLRRGLWSRLLEDSGLGEPVDSPDEATLARGIRRIAHIDDTRQIDFLLEHLTGERSIGDCDAVDLRRLTMLHATLWSREGAAMSLEDADERLRRNPLAAGDLRAVLEYRRSHSRTRRTELLTELAGPLAVHAEYTRDEILVGLGHWRMDHRPDFREGTLHLSETRVDAFFVTLEKTEEAYSPTTMYEDYAISDRLFHWQSQSTTSEQSPTGQRYIHHQERGYTPILFVREHKKLVSGLTSPYIFLGPARYVSHEGSRPVSFIWRLETPLPARLLARVSRGRVG